MIRGQCLCGAVQYHYKADLTDVIICHCLDCRKAQGALFGYNSPIDEKLFILEQGHHVLKEYFFTPNKARVFCMHCASPIYSYRKDLPNILRLRLGTVTEGYLPCPKEEFFVEHRPEFLNIILQTCE